MGGVILLPSGFTNNFLTKLVIRLQNKKNKKKKIPIKTLRRLTAMIWAKCPLSERGKREEIEVEREKRRGDWKNIKSCGFNLFNINKLVKIVHIRI